MAAPVTVSNAFARQAGTATPTVSLASVPDGAWMIAVLIVGSAVTVGGAPAGWTNLTTSDQPIGSRVFRIAAKIKTSGDTSLAWNPTASAFRTCFVMWGTGGDAVSTWVKGLIGVRNATNVVAGQSTQAGTSTTTIAPSITVPSADCLVLSIFLEATTAVGTASLTAGGATEWYQVTESGSYIETLLVGTRTPAAGASGNVTATYTQTQASNSAGIQIAIPAAVVAPPDPEGLDAFDGEGTPVKVFYIDENGDPQTPAALIPIPKGYDSVADMLSRDEFYWAHRGGSGPYPEHSLWAYTQSVIRWYGALEVSLARTSDGVWFALHDVDINRSSGLAAGTLPAASSMTWAQVNAYNITIGATGAPRPYMRWTDLVTAYGDTHVIIADPKHATAYFTEFFDMLESTMDKTRVIAKYFYDSTNFKNLAIARGIASWGYTYEANLGDAQLATRLAGWTLLGLEYTATQTAWDTVLSYNPLVVGHICPDQAAVNTARTKGASGFQCSGVNLITPIND